MLGDHRIVHLRNAALARISVPSFVKNACSADAPFRSGTIVAWRSLVTARHRVSESQEKSRNRRVDLEIPDFSAFVWPVEADLARRPSGATATALTQPRRLIEESVADVAAASASFEPNLTAFIREREILLEQVDARFAKEMNETVRSVVTRISPARELVAFALLGQWAARPLSADY